MSGRLRQRTGAAFVALTCFLWPGAGTISFAQVSAAGAVFLGHWSPESIGDYCAGPNHTLPTHGYAKAYSGLSLEDFQKRITVQELTAAGLADLGPTARTLADLEGLDGHAAAVSVRLASLEGGRA